MADHRPGFMEPSTLQATGFKPTPGYVGQHREVEKVAVVESASEAEETTEEPQSAEASEASDSA